MLRILYVVNVLGMGGAEIFLLRKIERLRKCGHIAALAFCEKQGYKIDEYVTRHTNNDDVFSIPYDINGIEPIIRQLKPDVVHAVQAHPFFLRRAKQINPNIVCVSSITGDVWPADLKFNHRIYTDAIVTMANAFVAGIESKLKSPSKNVIVIENGIDVDWFDPLSPGLATAVTGLNEPIRVQPQTKIVLQIGRIHPTKNIEDSLRIARKLCDQRNDVVFLFAGGRNPKLPENYFHEMLSMRDKLQLTDQYLFLGERSDIRDLLSVATCVLSTTRLHEGTPNALLETLSMGKPIVALECDGIHDVVLHGSTGFIENNVSDAANDLLLLMNDDSLRNRMAAAAREYALKRFRLDSAVDQYEALYQDLLNSMDVTLPRRAWIRAGLLRNHFEEKVLTPIFHKN